MAIMGKDGIYKSQYFADCVEKYRIYMGMDVRGDDLSWPKGLDDKLDENFDVINNKNL